MVELRELLSEICTHLSEDSRLEVEDLPLERVTSFVLLKDSVVVQRWVLSFKDLASLPKVQMFVLSSTFGRELLAKTLSELKNFSSLHSIFDSLYLSCIDQEWNSILESYNRQEAILKSKKLLMKFLSSNQIQEFQNTDGFSLLVGKERFLLTSRGHCSFDENTPRWSFCIHSLDWIPIYDQMLAAKLLLETDLELFKSIAHKRELSDQERNLIIYQYYNLYGVDITTGQKVS